MVRETITCLHTAGSLVNSCDLAPSAVSVSETLREDLSSQLENKKKQNYGHDGSELLLSNCHCSPATAEVGISLCQLYYNVQVLCTCYIMCYTMSL